MVRSDANHLLLQGQKRAACAREEKFRENSASHSNL
jgi:hypothetical protein